MNISALGLLFGLLLLIVPLYIIYYFKLNVMRRFTIATVRMIIGVAIMSLIIWGGIALHSIAYDIAVFLLLTVFSALFTLGRARLNTSRLLVPVGVGAFAGIALVSFYCLFLVFGLKNPFEPHLFVPFTGIIAGAIISADAKALQTYYAGLLHHDQLYNYLLGNGGTHREAIRYFTRRCLQSSIVTVGRSMSRIVFMTAPVLLFALVMSGASVFTAAAFQVIFFIAVVSASLISLLVSLYLGQRYSFDEYQRLKPVAKTSSSPSKPRDTDPASQPQEATPENRQQE